jgi:DNA-directed RNA polymerase beta' subunit
MGAEGIKLLRTSTSTSRSTACATTDRLRAQGQEERKRLKVLEAFKKSGIKPEWMVLKCCRCCRRTCVRWCRWTAAASPPRT